MKNEVRLLGKRGRGVVKNEGFRGRPLSQTTGDSSFFCLTVSADGAAGQTERTVPVCLWKNRFTEPDRL